jgi:hypothetical protein
MDQLTIERKGTQQPPTQSDRKEEFKNFSIDEFDMPGGGSQKMDFGIDDDFASVGTFYYNPKVAEMTEPTLGRLSRMPEDSSLVGEADACESYLQKKSPALFIKWQVRLSV